MKKLLFSAVILTLMGISSCSKNNNNPSIKNLVVTTVSAGSWKITYFFETNIDHTSNFSGYNFTFGSNNVLSASNGANTYTGSWNIVNNNSNDDTLGDIDFLISFVSPANFTSLSEDWAILTRTSSKIELKHVSGGSGGTDLLTFEKN
jgi:hypothetical protein